MGSGAWDASTYASTTSAKISSGTTYGHTTRTASKPRSSWAAHTTVDPKVKAGKGSPFEGKNVRESRDNADHPTSTPIAIWFDETGSMGNTPRVLQTKLAELFGLLLRKGYVEHPQILMGAYGDGEVDSVPLQASQFESDNRIDDALDNLFLEQGGGGNNGESQNLAWYFTATHTATDAWDKRGKKGYAFFIGDEKCIDLTDEMVKTFCDDGQPLIPTDNESVVAALLEKWEAYVFVINNHASHAQKSVEFYTNLFGSERVLVVQDETAIAETIALSIGLNEGVIDLDDGAADLADVGVDGATIAKATKALANVGASAGNGTVVSTTAPDDLDDADNITTV